MAHLAHHLHIVGYPLAQSLCFQQLALKLEVHGLSAEVDRNLIETGGHALGRCDKQVGRIDVKRFVGAERGVVVWAEGGDRLNLIAPKHDAQGYLLVGQVHIDRVAFHSESASAKLHLVAAVECIDKLAEQFVALDALPYLQRNHIGVEVVKVHKNLGIFTPAE